MWDLTYNVFLFSPSAEKQTENPVTLLKYFACWGDLRASTKRKWKEHMGKVRLTNREQLIGKKWNVRKRQLGQRQDHDKGKGAFAKEKDPTELLNSFDHSEIWEPS